MFKNGIGFCQLLSLIQESTIHAGNTGFALRKNRTLQKADLENEHLDFLRKLAKTDLLVLDDFGLMDLDPDKCRNLFELIDTREARKSTIVVSQLPVKAWYDLFKDNTYADSCMDRLVHKAYRLEFHGKNMRNPTL